MSDVETAVLTEEPAREHVKGNSGDGLIHREFVAELTAGEGRTVDVRIVPYGERIEHNDGLGGVPRGVFYREEWMPGVFAHQVNAANRVVANYEHDDRLAGVVGHAVALRDAPDGFHGSFVMHDNPDGDKALLMVKQGVLAGVSLEAAPVKNVRSKDGVIQRIKANLRAVALTRFPAYQNARVLAVREEPSFVWDEELLPAEMPDEVVERCRRLGIKLPQRYQAHPDETDTPAETGTSVSGTRQTGEDHSDLEGTGDGTDAG